MSEAAVYSPIAVGAVHQGQSTRGWFGIALTCGVSGVAIAALWFSGHSQLLRVAIPAAAFFVGVVLYFSAPIRYVEYSLWLWFLTPLVRRLVDWHFGYADPNFVLLSPLLVSGIGGLALLRPNRQHAMPRIPASFVLCGAAISTPRLLMRSSTRPPRRSTDSQTGCVPCCLVLYFLFELARLRTISGSCHQDVFVRRSGAWHLRDISICRSASLGQLLARNVYTPRALPLVSEGRSLSWWRSGAR